MIDDYKDAERKVETFLSSLYSHYFRGGELYKLIPVDSERIIKRGSNSLILEIENTGLIARIISYRIPSESIHPGSYGLWGFDSTEDILSTTDCLEGLGFNNVTKLHPYDREYKNNNCGPDVIYISKDLRENGTKEVYDISDIDFKILTNGKELYAEYKDSINRISSAIDEKRLSADVDSHGDKHNYKDAVKNMFFVVKDIKDNKGRLVIEDLDHIVLRKL